MGSIATYFSTFIRLFLFWNSSPASICTNSVDSVYQFGDSFSDTGNLIRVPRIGSKVPCAHYPYGETFTGSPTGRYSDGKIIIDHLTEALGLPLLNPYRDTNASFVNGVNFAVGGSTALNVSFFSDRGISGAPKVNVPLTNQTEWFRQYLASISSSPNEHSSKLRNSLVVLGVTGANDLIYGFTQGKSLEEVRTFIPHIVQVILDNAREIIRDLGATRIVVPGNFPLGCFPVSLIYFSSTNPTSEEFDEYGCSKSYNDVVGALNTHLQSELDSLRWENPDVTIVYADFYQAFFSVLSHAPALGFNTGSSLLKDCCGRGGQYNYDATFGGANTCGAPGVPFCSDPRNYIHWDGIHLTQEAYSRISEILIPGILSKVTC